MSTGKRYNVNQKDFLTEFKTDCINFFYILQTPWLPQAQRRLLPQYVNSTTGHRKPAVFINDQNIFADINLAFPCSSSCAAWIKAIMLMS